MQDFEIFPNFITKLKIMKIYNTLANLHARNEILNENNAKLLEESSKKSGISKDSFIDGLALCALDSNMASKIPIIKLRTILEVAVNSKGPQLLVLNSGKNRTSKIQQSNNLVLLRNRDEIEKKLYPSPINFEKLLENKPVRSRG